MKSEISVLQKTTSSLYNQEPAELSSQTWGQNYWIFFDAKCYYLQNTKQKNNHLAWQYNIFLTYFLKRK